jgi:hypothetical protein
MCWYDESGILLTDGVLTSIWHRSSECQCTFMARRTPAPSGPDDRPTLHVSVKCEVVT